MTWKVLFLMCRGQQMYLLLMFQMQVVPFMALAVMVDGHVRNAIERTGLLKIPAHVDIIKDKIRFIR